MSPHPVPARGTNVVILEGMLSAYPRSERCPPATRSSPSSSPSGRRRAHRDGARGLVRSSTGRRRLVCRRGGGRRRSGPPAASSGPPGHAEPHRGGGRGRGAHPSGRHGGQGGPGRRGGTVVTARRRSAMMGPWTPSSSRRSGRQGLHRRPRPERRQHAQGARALRRRPRRLLERRRDVRPHARDADPDHHQPELRRRPHPRRHPLRADDGPRDRGSAAGRLPLGGQAASCRSSRSTRASPTRPTARRS